MGQRNVQCAHSILVLGPQRTFSQSVCDDRVCSGDFFTYGDSILPVSSRPRSSADAFVQQFMQHHDGVPFYSHQYENIQQFHHIPNHVIGGARPPNLYYPPMLPPSSSQIFHSPNPEFVQSSSNAFGGTGISEYYDRYSVMAENIGGSCKRKNAEMVPENFNQMNGPEHAGPPLNLFQNSGLPGRYVPPFAPPEYQSNRSIVPNGSDRSAGCRPGPRTIQSEAILAGHSNYLLPGNSSCQSFPPTNGAWMVQFENNISNRASPNWNNVSNHGYMQGRCPSSGGFESPNIEVQAYQEALSSSRSAFAMNSASHPDFHQNLVSMRNMQSHNYGHHIEVPTRHRYPFSSLQRNNINASLNHPDPSSRYPVFYPGNEMINMPHRQPPLQAQEEFMDFAQFYGVEDLVDQHSNLRMDIENMSYEELLALEEQIGDVNTGLAEESIVEKLKTAAYDPLTTSCDPLTTSLHEDCSSERETCVICQVEFVERERIGTLDCGHYYHAECIKQWLLVKNVCPVCKEIALSLDRKEG